MSLEAVTACALQTARRIGPLAGLRCSAGPRAGANLALACLLWLSYTVHAQTPDCPAPEALLPVALHGFWQAQFTQPPASWPAQARVRLQAHVEFRDSLSGTVQRASGPTALAHLAGDLDEGVLVLDESSDGVHITAVWEGAVQPGSCGREIRGHWKDTRSSGVGGGSTSGAAVEIPFVLTRSSAW